MASVPNKTTKFHFTHPNHPLLFHSHHDYICDGCLTSGSGSRFRCDSCDFDLHEYCADCPEKLISSSIHHHPLTLVFRNPDDAGLNHRFCDICRHPVGRLVYQCKGCDFDAHPLCTQLPEDLRHVTHSKHGNAPPYGVPYYPSVSPNHGAPPASSKCRGETLVKLMFSLIGGVVVNVISKAILGED